MANYKKMYLESFTAMQRCVELLQEAQLASEEEYIKECEENITLGVKNLDPFAEASRVDVSSDKKIIGKNIRDLRERESLSIEQMAKIMDISSSRLVLLEYSEENASLESLCRLANYFRVSVDSFLVPRRYDEDFEKSCDNGLIHMFPRKRGYSHSS